MIGCKRKCFDELFILGYYKTLTFFNLFYNLILKTISYIY